jgi:membrane fusion protein (multidrug efflux system)
MTTAASPIAARRRRPLLGILLVLCLAGAAGAGIWYWQVGRFFEHTDDAYVNAHVVQVTPLVTGTVRAVKVRDTDRVNAGDLLVELDAADARVALDAAESELARTVREVHNVYATNATLDADVAVKRAALLQARAEVDRARDDLATRAALVATGAVGKEELRHADAHLKVTEATAAAADAAVRAAVERLAANKTLTDGVPIAEHPAVQRASARVREAHLAWQRTRILSPIDGDVARRAVQVGQRVQPGAPLLSVVPLSDVWVDANFKEVQLRRMRIGQPAKVVADLYGKHVTYDGTIVGFGAGTGAAFALLPAQNASGNWIKIVQRVPVRIELDRAQVAAHPLRVGLSMDVEVDLHHVEGDALRDAPRMEHASNTTIFDDQLAAASLRIAEIIQANLGDGRASVAAQDAPSKP